MHEMEGELASAPEESTVEEVDAALMESIKAALRKEVDRLEEDAWMFQGEGTKHLSFLS